MSWVMAAGAGVGLLKSELIDKKKEERDRQLAATTQRLSPWTGLKANPIKEADPFGSALQGAAFAGNMKQSIDKNAGDLAEQKARTGWLDRQGQQPNTFGAMRSEGPNMASMNGQGNWTENNFQQPEFGSQSPNATTKGMWRW